MFLIIYVAAVSAVARCASPVRFSPSVVEKKGRGILKKHRSLDEPQAELHNLQVCFFIFSLNSFSNTCIFLSIGRKSGTFTNNLNPHFGC